MRKSLHKILAAIGVLALSACNVAAQTRVTIGYASSALSLITAPWLVAKQLGFFQEQGLDVNWIVLNGGVNALQQTMTKAVDVTYPSVNELVAIGKQEGRGEPLPVKFFYLGFPHNIWQFAVLQNSPIQSLADLQGRRLGIFANQAAYLPQIRALARHEGLSPDRDIQLRIVGVGAGALQALQSGQTDISVQGEVQHAAFETMGSKLRRLPFPANFELLHGPGFLTHVDNLVDLAWRKVMEAVARGTAMGTLFCQTNPESCLKLAWEAAPVLKPLTVDSKSISDGLHILNAVLADMELRPEQNGQYGLYVRSSWQRYVDILKSNGEITKPVDIDELFTNDLIAAANSFDHERIVSLARAYQ
jgi:NitT/TauT family transport system substrate-binding protein